MLLSESVVCFAKHSFSSNLRTQDQLISTMTLTPTKTVTEWNFVVTEWNFVILIATTKILNWISKMIITVIFCYQRKNLTSGLLWPYVKYKFKRKENFVSFEFWIYLRSRPARNLIRTRAAIKLSWAIIVTIRPFNQRPGSWFEFQKWSSPLFFVINGRI